MQKLSSIKLRLNQSEGELLAIATKTLGHVPAHFRILKKSIDARNKNDVHYVYSIEFGDERVEKQRLERIDKSKLPDKPIVIVGSGPAGLFCAIRLIERGFAPIVIERGDCVEKRVEKCNALAKGVLDT
ncbi:MAG: FAD-binding protein, partial [Clostridia bacterium]|nr:FAD-binding protein [Clostridia bacterium]